MNKNKTTLLAVGSTAARIMLLGAVCALPTFGWAKNNKKAKAETQSTEVQTQQQEPAADEEPVITQEILENISLFTESAKNKQYADAVEYWMMVYTTCPNAHKSIYTYGPKIIAWQILQATSEEEKEVLRTRLMEMYDKRIKYFGNDANYPTPYILGLKALDYCNVYTEDALKQPAYEWLKQSIDGMGEKSQITVLAKYAELSNLLYKSNPEQYAEQYIADYQLVSDLLNKQAANTANKNAAVAKQTKEYIDNIFAVSGAADCSKLDELYAAVVDTNKGDVEMLTKIMKLYRRVDCSESPVYFAAAEAAHLLQPTEESAAGCAKMCLKKEDYKGAVEYYENATLLAENAEDKADYQYRIAYIYFVNLKNYPISRQYARKSLEYNDKQGRCYILIGMLYASSKPYDDPVLNKTVFWAACDKLAKAKQVDPSCADDAQKLINTYSQYFPTSEEIFFNAAAGLQKGKPFTVGGWIGESTICR
ncbi:MAG: hypothetical protein NC038_03290 [Paludibacter sp.]|nr:hypothetical protein [Bacteroidales bacterium]MCM1069105.1 hypothetical protein [Prevotella sp.]MCM1353544.1 hypothetical protein [Bacteroides sp.]MCM1442705.1 hypothetical protein [Muribaculum sp.]MCM1481659.1 hypothetical protein [Paludibacter sp.]